MDHVDLILKLKDLLKDTCGKQAISRLIQLPLIVDYLSDPNNFQLVVDKYGKDCQNWDPIHICRAASGFELKSPSLINSQIQDDAELEAYRNSISPQAIEKINSVVEIYPLAIRINTLSNRFPFSQILEQIEFGSYSFTDPKRKLETIFAILFEISEDKKKFIDGLNEYHVGSAGLKMLSWLVLNNKSVNDFIIHALETKSFKPSSDEIVSLLKELRYLGDQKKQRKLAEVYLNVFPLDEKSQINKTQIGIADDLTQLQFLKNYSALFQIVGNNDELEKLTHSIKDVLSNLGQGLGFTTHFENGVNQIQDALGKNNTEREITREIKRIKDIAETDFDSAGTLALEISQKLLGDPDLANSIIDKDYGLLIAPETLAQFLMDFGLFSQVQAILNKLLLQWPQDSALLRIAANLAHDKGDHRNAAEKFALLDVYDELTREEKLKFAFSLEYLESWENAFEIRKTINFSNDEDFRNTFLCAFYAEKINALSSLILDKGEMIRSSKIALLLQNIADENKEQITSIIEKLDESDYSNEKDHYYFLLISDYLQKFGKIDSATAILENCTRFSRYSFPIVNRLYSIYQKRGEHEKCLSILNSITNQPFENQKDFETFVNILVQSGEIDRANQLLTKNGNSWELSPRIINLHAKILIERGNFSEAQRILIPLVQNVSNDNEYKLNYCLALLKCKFENFPFGIGVENREKLEEIRKIIKFDEEKKSLFLELLDAEFETGSRFEKYQQLLNDYSSSGDPDVWRIYAGLGKIYSELNQFDSAIINLKRAHQIEPSNQVIFWLLIQGYANLRLWNEIENLLNQGMVQDSQSILSNFREFSFLSENSEWPHFLENQIQRKPEEILYKIFLAQYFAENDKKAEAVDIIKSFYEKLKVDNELYLLCVQILLDANEAQLAERLIEIFLVNKKSPDQSDYLACAFLYEQLGRSEKALTMMNHVDNQDFALLTFKAKLLNDVGKTEQYQKLISEIIDKDDQIADSLGNLTIRIPDFVKQILENPTQIYLMATTIAIKGKDTNKAISILERGLKKNPDDRVIQFNLLELINLTGKKELFEGLWEKLSGSASENQSSSLLSLLGEIALSHGEEIKSVQYLSEALRQNAENPRIKALQARILAINGNVQEAKINLDDVIQTIDKANSGIVRHTAETYSVDSMFWLAKAAKDLKDNKTTLEICRQEIKRFGYHLPLIDLFLSAFSAELENNFVLREVKANDQNDLDLEEWQKIFSKICENSVTAHSGRDFYDDLITKCQIFLDDDPKFLASAEKLDPDPENINSIIYAVFKLKGLEAAEIAFNSFTTDEKNELFLAILGKDLDPEKSLGHLQKAMRSSTPDALIDALLAIIEKNLGNLSDAYAAISLALEKCPDEYEWQIMAGDLCKLKGDLHMSISHYQKAQSLNLTKSIDKKLDNLYLSLGTPEAIPILEKQVSTNPNLDQFIQLGKIYIKSGNYRKAVNVFESAIKEYPQKANPYYWLSEIALNLDNPEKALDNIEEAISRDSLNNQFLCKKAEIISKTNGFPQAISYIDNELAKKGSKDIELLKYKVKLISEHNGENEALKALNSIPSLSEIPELMLEKAFLELRLGKIGESELIAEKLLDIKEVKSDSLALLGSISKTKGEFDRAIDFYIKSIEADPFSIERFIQLAEIYHDRKEFKSAIKTLEDGIRSNPGSFDLLYRSGLYFYQQGGYNEAGKYIREAIKIKPDHRESKELLGLLNNVIAVRNYSLVDQVLE